MICNTIVLQLLIFGVVHVILAGEYRKHVKVQKTGTRLIIRPKCLHNFISYDCGDFVIDIRRTISGQNNLAKAASTPCGKSELGLQ